MAQRRAPGLYEELITRRLEAELERIREEGWRDQIADLDPAEAPQVLACSVHDLLEPMLGPPRTRVVCRHRAVHVSLLSNLRLCGGESPMPMGTRVRRWLPTALPSEPTVPGSKPVEGSPRAASIPTFPSRTLMSRGSMPMRSGRNPTGGRHGTDSSHTDSQTPAQ